MPPSPPSPPRVFGANCLFSTRWRRGSTLKYIAFNNIEGKVLKTWNLLGLVCETQEAGATPRVYAENTTLKDRLAHWEEMIGNGLSAEGADDKGDSLRSGEWGLTAIWESL